ncbi:MAG: PTS sugar transporter subunit IIA [candidate division WOR-3 bacterium]|nr:MAG: PTS sugar transporter subunit IIA [candidate division WOR-3 bacterium]
MLTRYLKRGNILLNATNNNYRELLSTMLAKSAVTDISGIIDKIFEREKIMPTALGKGIFLPRVILNNIERTEILIMVNHDGIVFDDYGTTVANVVMLLLLSKRDDYTTLLAQCLRLLNDDCLRSDLLHCRKVEDVIKTIRDWEEE